MKKGTMAINDSKMLAREWHDLDAAGIPLAPLENRIGVDPLGAGSSLTIRRGRDGMRSEIRELKGGRFAYVLPVFVRRNRPGKTIIREHWLEAPWLPPNIDL